MLVLSEGVEIVNKPHRITLEGECEKWREVLIC